MQRAFPWWEEFTSCCADVHVPVQLEDLYLTGERWSYSDCCEIALSQLFNERYVWEYGTGNFIWGVEPWTCALQTGEWGFAKQGWEHCCKAFVRKVHVLCYSPIHLTTLLGPRDIVPDVSPEKPGTWIELFLVGWVGANVEKLAGKSMILMSSCSRMRIFIGCSCCQW